MFGILSDMEVALSHKHGIEPRVWNCGPLRIFLHPEYQPGDHPGERAYARLEEADRILWLSDKTPSALRLKIIADALVRMEEALASSGG